MADLTDKQKKFCEQYVLDFNGAQAAIRAGYSEDTAKEIASENLTKPNIQEYLAQLKSQAASEYGITKQQLIDELRKVAFFDIRKIYSEDNSLLNIKSFDDDSAGAVAGIEIDELWEYNPDLDKREVVGNTKKVKIHNKISAIERVSKMLGYDAPIQTEVKANIIWNEQKTYDAPE